MRNRKNRPIQGGVVVTVAMLMVAFLGELGASGTMADQAMSREASVGGCGGDMTTFTDQSAEKARAWVVASETIKDRYLEGEYLNGEVRVPLNQRRDRSDLPTFVQLTEIAPTVHVDNREAVLALEKAIQKLLRDQFSPNRLPGDRSVAQVNGIFDISFKDFLVKLKAFDDFQEVQRAALRRICSIDTVESFCKRLLADVELDLTDFRKVVFSDNYAHLELEKRYSSECRPMDGNAISFLQQESGGLCSKVVSLSEDSPEAGLGSVDIRTEDYRLKIMRNVVPQSPEKPYDPTAPSPQPVPVDEEDEKR